MKSLFAASVFSLVTLVSANDANAASKVGIGFASGELTVAEASVLKSQANSLNSAKRAAARDGKITRAEARKIEKLEDRLKASTKRLTHNRRDR